MKSSTYPWASAEAFEQFLRGQGFPAHQAHAITTKGFGGGFSGAGDSAQVAALVREIQKRQQSLIGPTSWKQTPKTPAPPGFLQDLRSSVAKAMGSSFVDAIANYVAFGLADAYLANMEAQSKAKGKSFYEFTLGSGRREFIYLPMSHKDGFRGLVMKIDGQSPSAQHQFQFVLDYPVWSSGGVQRFKKHVETDREFQWDEGTKQDIQKWLLEVDIRSFAIARGNLGDYGGPTALLIHKGQTPAKYQVIVTD